MDYWYKDSSYDVPS